MPLEIDFGWNFKEFCEEKESKLALKSMKNDVICEQRIFEKSQFFFGKNTIFKVLGFQDGSQNRSKIDQTLKSKLEWLLASMFHRCWWFWEASWEGTSSQDRSKIDPKRHRINGEQKECVLKGSGGMRLLARLGGAGFLLTPYLTIFKENKTTGARAACGMRPKAAPVFSLSSPVFFLMIL